MSDALKKEEMRENFIKENLYLHFDKKEELDEAYQEILKNTEKVEIPLKDFFLETSNEKRGLLKGCQDQVGIREMLSEEEKALFDAGVDDFGKDGLKESYLGGEFLQGDVEDDVVNYTNTHSTLWAMIPDDLALFHQKRRKVSFLQRENGVKLMKEVGYHLLPLSYQGVRDVVTKKMGMGRPLHSLYLTGDGKLKKEISELSILFSGKNADNEKDGFFKTTYGIGKAYLSNFTDAPADVMSDVFEEVMKDLGVDDLTFYSGSLDCNFYRARYVSEKLGKEILDKVKIKKAESAKVFLDFETSDYGFSSLRLEPILKIQMKNPMYQTLQPVSLKLSPDGVSLPHSAGEVSEEAWKKKCQEAFTLIKESGENLKECGEKIFLYPSTALGKLLAEIGLSNFYKHQEDLQEEFQDLFFYDCTALDMYIFLSKVVEKQGESNVSLAIKAKDKLCRILVNGTWSSFGDLA